MYPHRWHQASLLVRRRVGHLFNIMAPEDASLQNSFLFIVCQKVCGMRLFHMSETALLLYLMPMAQTFQFDVHVVPMVFLELFTM